MRKAPGCAAICRFSPMSFSASLCPIVPSHAGKDLFGLSSTAIRDRIARARQKQHERFARDAKTNCNARMTTRHLKTHCKLNADSQELIRIAMTELNLSARAYDRILKISRTIADLDDRIDITSEHVSEPIQYRRFDRTLWI